MRRRYGRDNVQHSFWAGLAGFLIVPAAAGVASGLVSKVAGTAPQATAAVYAAGHLAGLGFSWWGQRRYPQAHSFLRGAMWGEGIVGTLAVTGAASMIGSTPSSPPNAVAASAPTPTALKSLAQQLVGSGFVRR